MKLSNLFYLRRTQEINNKYLPNKIENIIYCNPTPLQVSIYQNMSHLFLSDSTDPLCHLLYINALKKLCNCPSLLYQSSGDITGSNMSSILTDIKRCYPEDYRPDECCVENSGKLWVLSAMLECLRANNSREKIVIVSNYTKTLNVLEKLCQRFEYSFLRLDGATPVTTRQKIVDSFNSKYNNAFAFLLSSKAGGVGLNLIGASRLILYDIDWNPANDLQAMARVWRDGQVNTVHIYRLLTTGTIEEKIFQRQIAKQGLSDAVDTRDGGSGAGAIHFTKEELKDLFSLDVSTQSITHDQLNCQCLHRQKSNSLEELLEERITNVDDIRVASLNNQPIRTELKNSTINKLNEWDHIPPPFDAMKDQLILHAANNISFVMVNESNT
jgi:DNA repair and recombination protein RAD54B